MTSRKGFKSLEVFADEIQAKLLSQNYVSGNAKKVLLVFIGEEGSDQVEIYEAPQGSTFWSLLTSGLRSFTYDPTREIFWAVVLRTQTKTRSVVIVSSPPSKSDQTLKDPPIETWERKKVFWKLSENI